ncbi:centromere-associated protein E isoform X3 [Apodemus sylvaticus]|uniref:centromere-associated protein E isoform X3 n=1 Tax=Apodemus sylvaticus TaxID=10129 RepID=UPI002242DEBB|nr:centromere-associated protein E isoform X3 [Apodemus sylvaticus]
MAEEAAVAVCVRVRPLNSREELEETTHVYWKTDSNTIYQSDGGKSFQFDRVFHSEETTKNVYEEIAVPIISSAIQGYNGTIFAYGQTASGKTHTMMGSEDCLGVIPRAIHDIFKRIKKFPEREFLLRVSYMEIYNETITDLLCNAQKMKPLIIREDINRNVYVADLTEEVVYTAEMALKWLATGEKNRHYGITKMNQRSSRSHTIFRMILESREKGESSNCDGSIKVSHLNLVDLAGSERAAQTGAEGVRLKEGCFINRNLLILGQVIKKLSDGQVGGFINYRDSKLTRILQNSLGGNAKTRIICTITPVSFDETLTTLQFASTAKYMKNTPYVNEVSNDEALLKRYRREIVDLKKQLEEVNTKTRAQEMEKDQLAQLLDEKDLLQKVQDEKIQNLKRMLVTSSSLAMQQDLEIKKKRRVTWCYGKMKDSNYEKEFKIPTNITTRKRKTSVTSLRENSIMKLGESALSWESEVFSNTLEPLPEDEWSSASVLLSEENVESELNSLNAQYNDLVLDYEQLRRENEDLKLKLKEKNELEEFEFLEQKEEKDQEMQLMHEVSNLKNLIKHAEEYNQDLENELSSKVELLKEKEDQIKNLQEYIDAQKSEKMKIDVSYSSDATEDLKQAMRTLSDLDIVALDAKREASFLRSENMELKEKINELSNSCKQMENDIQMYQHQLEAKKKMKTDLDKELQLAFQEISKLSALVDGKGLSSNLELEKRITDLQKELNKEVQEKETLQKEVTLLSELKSLPSEVEMLRRELHEKSEELCVITTEREKLFSEIAHKDSRIQGLLEEIGNTKDDLAASRLSQRGSEEEWQALRSLHTELERRHEGALEESERAKQEMATLSQEAERLALSLDSMRAELSHKTQELEQKTVEAQERLTKMEELREELESRDSSLQSVEKEKALLTEQLRQTLEEVQALTQEKKDLQQLQKSLQTERDQLKSDIQDTVNMNIDTQEQLLNALESLKQHQETINTLKKKAAEEMPGNLHTKASGGARDEAQAKMDDIDEQNLLAESAHTLVVGSKDNEGTEEQRKIDSLMQENSGLQQTLESVRAEKEQLKMDLKENIEMSIENQEQLRVLRDELKRHQEIAAQEKDHAKEKREELSRAQESLAEMEEKLKDKDQKLQETQQQLLSTQEAMSKMRAEATEVESLENEFRSQGLALKRVETERLELAQKLHENYEEMKAITKERNDLKELLESFEIEKKQLKEHAREIEAAGLQTKEELNIAHANLKEYQEIIKELRRGISEKEAQAATSQDTAKSYPELQGEHLETEEELNLAHRCLKDQEKKIDTLIMSLSQKEAELSSMRGQLESTTAELERKVKVQELCEKQEQLNLRETREAQGRKDELEQVRALLLAKDTALQSVESDRLHLSKQLEESQEEIQLLIKEREELRRTQEALHVESERQKESIKEMGAKLQELQDKESECLVMKTVNETQGNRCEVDLLKERLEAQKSSLEKVEMQNVNLTQRLHETLEEMKCIAKERAELWSVKERLTGERDQLKKSLEETVTKGLEKEEELRVAHMHLQEHQETINKLRKMVCDYTDEISHTQGDLKLTNAVLEAQSQELQEKEHQLSQVKVDLRETMDQMEKLKKQLEAQNSALESIEIEKLKLTQQLNENLKEITLVTKENDDLKIMDEALREEQDKLRKSLRETEASDLEKEEKLRIAHMNLKEHQERIDILMETMSKKTKEVSDMKMELETTNNKLQEKVEELKASELQLLKLKADASETQKQLKEQGLTLSKIEMENLNLAHKIHENLEEMKSVIKERDDLKRIEETLRTERDQLKNSLREAVVKHLETEEELNLAHRCLKDQEKKIDTLIMSLSQKEAELSSMRGQLESTTAELERKVQELCEKQEQLNLRETREAQGRKDELEQVRALLLAKDTALQSVESDRLHLSKQLEESQEEIQLLIKEREELRRTQEALHVESERQKESIKEMGAKVEELKASELQLLKLKADASETQKQLKEQGLTLSKIEMENLNLAHKIHENLEEMKSVIKERDDLKRIEETLRTERDQLKNSLREAVVKAHQKHEETMKYGKGLLCGGEQHCPGRLREKCLRIEKLLKRYSEMASDYECFNRFSVDLERETKTQKELSITIKTKLSLSCTQTKEIETLLTTNQRCSMEFHRVLKRLKYVLSNITRVKEEQHEFINKFEMAFIEEVEKQNELQIKIQSLSQTYHIPPRDLQIKLSQEMDLHIEEILKDFSENDFLTIKTEVQQVLSNRKEITERLEEWLNSLVDIENLKSSIQKENKSTGLVNNFYHSKITAMVNESTEFEEKSATRCKELEHYLKSLKETTEQLSEVYQTLSASQSVVCFHPAAHPSTQDRKNPQVASGAKQLTLKDKFALEAVPYKEEIEALKMQLVKTDLEKKADAKEFEKQILYLKNSVKHQEEMIRLLRENLRRNQQSQDISVISEDSQCLSKPLTCGGGSGIVQNTKALILRSEYKRMESENSKLKQQNEQLRKQNNQLLSDNSQLSKEIKTWEENTLKRDSYREAACENSPKSPKVTGTDSKRRQNTIPQCRERNFQDPMPKDSPKSWFFDNRSKSLPAPHPVRYFDNSSLGLLPEEPAEVENVEPKTALCHASSGNDVSECKMQ